MAQPPTQSDFTAFPPLAADIPPTRRRLRHVSSAQSSGGVGGAKDRGEGCPKRRRESDHTTADIDKGSPLERASLQNLGNTCWMNALTQAVLHLPELAAIFRDHQTTEACHAACTMCAWQVAEAATRTPAAHPVSLPMWAPVARRFGLDFNAQQDAAEVLTLLFDDLENDPRLCTALQTHTSATLRREPQCNCIAPYEHAAPGELSFVRPVAMETHAASKGAEMPSVAGLIKESSQWQGTDEDDSCRCPLCFAPIPSLRRFVIDKAGSVVCLEIKRFVNVATLKGPAKMKRLSDSLKLSPVLYIAGHAYALSSMVLHTGATPRSGHYTALVSVGSSWMVYDDGSTFKHVDIPKSAEKNAVILFYRRLQESPDSDQKPTNPQPSGRFQKSANSDQNSPDLQPSGHPAEESATSAQKPSTPQPSDCRLQESPDTDQKSANPQPSGCLQESVDSTQRPPNLQTSGPPAGERSSGGCGNPVDDAAEIRMCDPGCVTICGRCTQQKCAGAYRGRRPCGPGKLEHECESCASFGQSYMPVECSYTQLGGHVDELIKLWTHTEGKEHAMKACKGFLAALPTYTYLHGLQKKSSSPLAQCVHDCDLAIAALLQERTVNSSSALSVRRDYTDAHFYPLLVLLTAGSVATATPLSVLVDTVNTVAGAVLNRHLAVKLGRWKSKSRHWFAGTFDSGEGKSRMWKDIIDCMVNVLTAFPANAVGEMNDRFMFQESSSTAAAVDKARQAGGHCTLVCSDARRCVDMRSAVGGAVDSTKYVNLDFFLDAAHGDELSHATLVAKQRAAKPKLAHPAASFHEILGMHIDPTNIHVCWLWQNEVFVKYLAQLTRAAPVGTAQRFLLDFAGNCDPAPRALVDFWEELVLPILEKLFSAVVQRVGPKMVSNSVTLVQTTELQTGCLYELEEILKLHARSAGCLGSMKSSLPKCLYWLGTMLLTNNMHEAFWLYAVEQISDLPEYQWNISDACWAAGVAFLYRRYLPGQMILTSTIAGEDWLTLDLPYEEKIDEVTSLAVGFLKYCPGPHMTRKHYLEFNLRAKRAFRFTDSADAAHEEKLMLQVFHRLENYGVGRYVHLPSQEPFLHKYSRDALSCSVFEFLRNFRIPSYLFGYEARTPDPLGSRTARHCGDSTAAAKKARKNPRSAVGEESHVPFVSSVGSVCGTPLLSQLSAGTNTEKSHAEHTDQPTRKTKVKPGDYVTKVRSPETELDVRPTITGTEDPPETELPLIWLTEANLAESPALLTLFADTRTTREEPKSKDKHERIAKRTVPRPPLGSQVQGKGTKGSGTWISFSETNTFR